MAIVTGEMKFYKAKEVSDAATNGGRMSANEYVSGALNNVWPNAFSAERTAGSTKYRKIFAKVANDSDLTGYNPMLRFFMPTAGDDWVVLWPATQRDTQNDIVAADQKYGVGLLNTDVTAGGATLIVDLADNALKSGNDAVFASGDTIIISDKATWDAVAGNLEQHIIDTVTPHATLAQVTITLDGTTLANAYAEADSTKIMSVKIPSDIATSWDNWAETLGGTYDETNYPPVLDNIGTVEETWTLTFSDATNFTCVGDTLGSVGSGTVGSDFAPSNGDFTKPYFTLEAAGWGGTQVAGNTLVFQTHPASYPFWEKRVIPAACGSLANNKAVLVWSLESA